MSRQAMSDQAPALHAPTPTPTDSDYDSILAAVMETARGRWFLHEYARRNRSAETGALLAAIGRIEAILESRDDTPERAEQSASPADADARLAATHDAMAAILDSLVECGAPSFLCGDLARHLKTLRALGTPAQPAETRSPPVTVQAEIVDAEPAMLRTELPAVTIEPVADTAPIPPTLPAPEAAPEEADIFADIRALSPAEKVALFS